MLDLPDPTHPGPGMVWGDGFEIETLLTCRVAAAGLRITEVASVERRRLYGRTNLRTFADGVRVLRTLVAEHRRAAQTSRSESAMQLGVLRPEPVRP